jgi:hypothetical protein
MTPGSQTTTATPNAAIHDEPDDEEPVMKTTKLITAIPLATALTIGQAWAQGNPHLDPTGEADEIARFQGNPHRGMDIPGRYVARYRGNPHEGYAFTIARITRSRANPHAGFVFSPLKVASSQ